MQSKTITGLKNWISFFNKAEIPVLKLTGNELFLLLQQEKNPSARSVASIIKRDPLMTVKLLRYFCQHKHRSLEHEVMQAEQILIMLGVDKAMKNVLPEPTVEELLREQKVEVLINLLHLVHRSHIASNYAFEWAVRLHDTHFEEIRIAALLHDISELLMWCFAPTEMLRIREMQKKDKTLRSYLAQKQVLGFTLADLQSELVLRWSLPELLITLMDDHNASLQRVRNVVLAVNLARHSANGWDDAALPDDYTAIGELLRMPVHDVKIIVGAKNIESVNSQQSEH